MLGLADKSVQRGLLGAILAGEGKRVLELVDAQFALGVEPLALLRGVMALVNRVTVAQISGKAESTVSAEEREALEGWAKSLSAGQLHRLWQLLLKGHEEVRTAPDPLVSAQMALLRVLHAADMPDPGELVKRLEAAAAAAPMAASAGTSSSAPAAPAALAWTDVVAQVEASGQLRVSQIMQDWVRVVSLTPGELHYALAPGFAGDPAPDLRDALLKATGERWTVERGAGEGAPALRELADAAAAAKDAAMRRDPLVEAALAAFPGARFVEDEPEGRDWRNRA